MTTSNKLTTRFWEKVNLSGPVSPIDNTECWLWTASIDIHGYGKFWVSGRIVGAHRFSYQLSRGPINDKTLQIDHRTTCPKHCVNPNHLRLVTPKQNSENRAGAKQNSTSGVRGVCWDKERQRWISQIRHHGKNIRVGRFDTLAEAEAAVISRRNELFTHNDVDRRKQLISANK